MPVSYTSILEEAKCVRAAAGLFDVSHMGQVSVRGDGVVPYLQRIFTNDAARLAVGKAHYTLICLENGGVLDDCILYRKAHAHFYLCVNASNREAVWNWLLAHKPSGAKVELTDESDETALVALQGPRAAHVLESHLPKGCLESLAYYSACAVSLMGISCFLARTGYTGEDGFEIYCDAQNVGRLWDFLLEWGSPLGVTPCGLGARDILRTEMGYALYGHELSPDINPLEVGLGWVIKWEREIPFLGSEALGAIRKTGPSRMLVGLGVEGRRIVRSGTELLRNGEKCGVVTSGIFSPHRKGPLALALVRMTPLHQGLEFIAASSPPITLRVEKLPFVPSHVRTKTL